MKIAELGFKIFSHEFLHCGICGKLFNITRNAPQ
jgi:hypothetical protein